MPKLYIMVGVPGSGKSTYAERVLSKSATIFSSDKIRGELLGEENDQSNKDLIFSTLYSRARDCLLEGKDAVIDATNLNKFERARVFENFKDIDGIERISVFVNTPLDECLLRNNRRARVVPESVIRDFHSRLEKPSIEEGFDSIIEV